MCSVKWGARHLLQPVILWISPRYHRRLACLSCHSVALVDTTAGPLVAVPYLLRPLLPTLCLHATTLVFDAGQPLVGRKSVATHSASEHQKRDSSPVRRASDDGRGRVQSPTRLSVVANPPAYWRSIQGSVENLSQSDPAQFLHIRSSLLSYNHHLSVIRGHDSLSAVTAFIFSNKELSSQTCRNLAHTATTGGM